MRLLIACRAIDNMAGGVERQALALSNEMTKRGHEVCLFTLDHASANAFYEIDENVRWYKLNMGDSAIRASWRLRMSRMRRVRQIMNDFKPDVCLAFQDGMFISLRLYSLGMGIPIVAAERESPFRFAFISSGKYQRLIYQAMRFASGITVQCESYTVNYPKWLQRKITVIPNAIAQYQYKNAQISDYQIATEKKLLCVGRLGYQKNQILLTHVFSRLSSMFPNWKLIFVGEGEGRKDIERTISEYGLSEKIELVGAVKNVSDWYLKSEILCIPSRWEGFPNVVGEALTHGLPVIGFEGCGGVRDLVEDNFNGLLAEGNDNAESLFITLKEIMGDSQQRKYLKSNAHKSVQVYAPLRVYDQWEHFLLKVSQK